MCGAFLISNAVFRVLRQVALLCVGTAMLTFATSRRGALGGSGALVRSTSSATPWRHLTRSQRNRAATRRSRIAIAKPR